MSQYGFSKGGDDGGGFFAGGSQQGSQGGGGGGKSYQDESLRPVTIKQILDAEEAFAGADFKIDGSVVTQITFVGQIRGIQPQHTNVTYKIDDGTGQIDVKKWIDAEKQQAQGGGDESAADPGCEVDAYVRVWGRLKSFSNKRHVGAHVIRPVADFNEVNYHMLESTYVHLFFTKGDPNQAAGGAGGAGGDGDGMFVDGGAGYNGAGAGNSMTSGKLTGCTDLAKKVYNFINSSAGGNEGVHLNVITNQTGLSVREALAASDELLGQGLIYTTVDDETWAILEY